MGASVKPVYDPENPFAPKGQIYDADNPFAPKPPDPPDPLQALTGIKQGSASAFLRSALRGAFGFQARPTEALANPDPDSKVPPAVQMQGNIEQMGIEADHPMASTFGRLAGIIGSPINKVFPFLAAKAVPGAGLVPMVARGAVAGGAGAGTVAEVNRQPGEPISGDLVSAAGGAVLGGGIQIAAQAGRLGHLFSSKDAAARTVTDVVEGMGGRAGAEARLQGWERAGLGNKVTFADLSPQARATAQAAARGSNVHNETMAGLAAGRAEAAPSRLTGRMQDIGMTGDDASTVFDRVVKSRQAWSASDEGFEGLRQANPQIPALKGVGRAMKPRTERLVGFSAQEAPPEKLSPEVAGLVKRLKQPWVREAWTQAGRKGTVGNFPDKGDPSFQHLQDVKETLDDAVSAAYKSGKGNLGTKLAESRDYIREVLATHVEGYAERSLQYAKFKDAEEALLIGRKALAQARSPEAVSVIFSNLKPEQQEYARVGLATALRNQVGNSDRAGKILANAKPGSALRARLQVALNTDEAGVDQLVRYANKEVTLAKLQPPSMAPTIKRTAADVIGGAFTQGAVGTAVQRGSRAVTTLARSGAASEAQKLYGDVALKEGSAAIRALLDGPYAKPTPIRRVPDHLLVAPGEFLAALLAQR